MLTERVSERAYVGHRQRTATSAAMTAGSGASVRCRVMGGNRYIGMSLVSELARRGHNVTVMNSHTTPLPDGVRRLHGDRRQAGVIAEVLGPHRDDFDVVFD